MNIILITPVRNEEKYIEICIQCMLRQTLLPDKWIIVNDGSTDNTENIIKKFTDGIEFIQYISIPDRGYRNPGKGIVDAFYVGFDTLKEEEFDIIAKFDGDLSFPEHMIQKIIDAFRNDPALGITGGIRYDAVSENKYRKIIVPKFYVGGPAKFYRKECFKSINGLIRRAGWDGVDVVRAQKENWKTGEMESILIHHLRPTGTSSGEGIKKASLKYGDVSYYMGGYWWYFVLRVVGRSVQDMSFVMFYYMIKGFLSSKYNNLMREEKAYMNYYKLIQIDNIKGYMNLLFKKEIFSTKYVKLIKQI